MGEMDELKKAYLAPAQDLVTWQVEYIDNELRHGVSTNPQEDSLTVLDEEQSVPLELFRCERERRGHDHAVFAHCTTLFISRQRKNEYQNLKKNRGSIPRAACCVANRSWDKCKG